MRADRQCGEAADAFRGEERMRVVLRAGDSGEPRSEQRFVFGNFVREELSAAG